jgi:hypothetical protein
MKAYGSGCIDPHFLELGTSWRWVVNFTPRPLYPRERAPGARWIEGWVDLRASLDDLEKRNPTGTQTQIRRPSSLWLVAIPTTLSRLMIWNQYLRILKSVFLYVSKSLWTSTIITINKTRTVRWTDHVTRTAEKWNALRPSAQLLHLSFGNNDTISRLLLLQLRNCSTADKHRETGNILWCLPGNFCHQTCVLLPVVRCAPPARGVDYSHFKLCPSISG